VSGSTINLAELRRKAEVTAEPGTVGELFEPHMPRETLLALVEAIQAARVLRSHLSMVGGGRKVGEAVEQLDAALARFTDETA